MALLSSGGDAQQSPEAAGLARSSRHHAFLGNVARTARQCLACEVAMVGLSSAGRGFALVAVDGRASGPPGRDVAREASAWQRVESSGQPLAIEDLRDAGLGDGFEARDLALVGYLGAPIRTGDAIAGVVAVGDARSRSWSDEQVSILSALARMAAEHLVLCREIEQSEVRFEGIVHQLEAQQQRFERLFENAPEGIVLIGPDDRIQRVNTEFTRMFGYSSAESIGHKLTDLIVPEDLQEDSFRTTRESADGQTVNFESERRRKDGSLVPVSVLGAGIPVGDDEISIYAIYRDITERIRAQEALHRLATTDELTGLYNRRGFFMLADQQWRLARRHRRPMAMLFIDLDHFKQVNDEFGHEEGDRVLADVAALIRGCFRDTDVLARLRPAARPGPDETRREASLVARMGGDEFVLLAVEAAADTHELLTERLRQHVEAFNRSEGRPYRVSLSIGAVSIPADDVGSLDEWLREADRQMYRGKPRR